MKKIITIGRGAQCDICINDSTDVLSRNHAILEIKSNNKYFIIDQSRNGTYVNGMRISPNEKVPITRDDIISFAHVRELDWSLVPKNNNLLLWLGVVAAIVLASLALFLLIYNRHTDDNLNLIGKESVEQIGDGGGGVLKPMPEDKTGESDAEDDKAKADDSNAENDKDKANNSTTEKDKAKVKDSNQTQKQTVKKKNPVDAII